MSKRPIGRSWHGLRPIPRNHVWRSVTEELATRGWPRSADREDWPELLWEPIECAVHRCGRSRSNTMDQSCPLLVQRYARLASGSLTAVFILSQHDASPC